MLINYKEILLANYDGVEVKEIQTLLEAWDQATYRSVYHSVFDHANRHGYENNYLRYLRKASNFNKRGARRKNLSDGAIRWNKGSEFLIERDDRVISYGEN